MASTEVAVLDEKQPARVGGKFAKGTSGNPGGVSRIGREIREYARTFSREALDLLMAIGRNPELQPMARVRALELVLNRGHGVPAQDTSGLEELLDGGLKRVTFSLSESSIQVDEMPAALEAEPVEVAAPDASASTPEA